MIKRNFILTIALLLYSLIAYSQSTLILRATTIGYHPFYDANRLLYNENKIDENANFIIEPGIIFGIEKYIKGNSLSLQLLTGMYSDAAAMQAGFTGLSFRKMLYHKYKHHLSASVGAALLYRKDWRNFSEYKAIEAFNLNGKWENKFSVTSELNYNFYLTKKIDIELSIMYGHQYQTFTSTVGTRFWINSRVKETDCDCNKHFNQGRFRRIIQRLLH